ncbi:4-alpha-glucanotransferase [Campylobacterota bacterium]|nr:4-alpha-glucanotransferase [Campylobacterota bacterium]
MSKTTLLLGIHSHQPVGNFDHVVIDATARSYRPFFETLYKFEGFKFGAHFSGWLLEFIKTHDEKLFDLIRKMSLRGQIEWFSGGYYEPILASIPSADRRRQIGKLSSFIENNFGQKPKGLWLTERVWDASIIADLVAVGIEYVIVDDYHLLTAGVSEERLGGYYNTENGGEKLSLFPVSKKLRYQVPFWEHEQVIKNIAAVKDAAIVFDDGEKFGVWPGTHDWVYTKGWLENFVSGVLASEEIEAGHFRDYFAKNPPLGLAYPSEVSYSEMGEWSLAADDAAQLEYLKKQIDSLTMHAHGERFVRGATWKNFLVKYSESGRIHRRMLALSKHNPQNDTEFEDALLKAQCNDCLWHGIFGGLYLPNLRDNAWQFLIAAEDRIAPQNGISLESWNLDGRTQARLYSQPLIVGFEPTGGMLTELNLRKERFNLLNTLQRRREVYHAKIAVKSEASADGLRTIHDAALSADQAALEHLIVDRNQRGGFVDHLVEADFNPHSFFAQSYTEFELLSGTNYELTGDETAIALKTETIKKRVKLLANSLVVETEVAATVANDRRYVQEHNFHFANLKETTINAQGANDDHNFEAAKELIIVDSYLKKQIVLIASVPFEAFTHPVYTVSQSESGVDLTCQGVAIALVFGEARAISVTLEIREAK